MSRDDGLPQRQSGKRNISTKPDDKRKLSSTKIISVYLRTSRNPFTRQLGWGAIIDNDTASPLSRELSGKCDATSEYEAAIVAASSVLQDVKLQQFGRRPIEVFAASHLAQEIDRISRGRQPRGKAEYASLWRALISEVDEHGSVRFQALVRQATNRKLRRSFLLRALDLARLAVGVPVAERFNAIGITQCPKCGAEARIVGKDGVPIRGYCQTGCRSSWDPLTYRSDSDKIDE